mmetsp:Transcript_162459/g.299827  ORF Transcript_162459/g.299827 Transcript_162459/m.299827 type:complete len:81 (-) Transcript_162459:253-495(-)
MIAGFMETAGGPAGASAGAATAVGGGAAAVILGAPDKVMTGAGAKTGATPLAPLVAWYTFPPEKLIGRGAATVLTDPCFT